MITPNVLPSLVYHAFFLLFLEFLRAFNSDVCRGRWDGTSGRQWRTKSGKRFSVARYRISRIRLRELQRSCQQRVFVIPKTAFSKSPKIFTDIYALDPIKHFNRVNRVLVGLHFKILKRRISRNIAITNIYLISYNYRKQNRYSLFRVVWSFVKRM